MTDSFDLIVIGAGPAGMAAAIEARRHRLAVLVLDEQPRPGGQIYRDVTQGDSARERVLGSDYQEGKALARDFLGCGALYLPGAAVWQVTPERSVHYLIDGRAEVAVGRYILIATGAMERPMPIPGWTLPGVMTAGAGQILLKSAALLPTGPVILAGSGPLLYLLAVQYLDAGIAVSALVDTAERNARWRAWRHWWPALGGWRDLRKGLRLLGRLRASSIPHYRGARELNVDGEGTAIGLSFQCNGHPYRLPANLILLHQGVVPNNHISRALRLEHHWDEAQSCWRVKRDAWGRTTQAEVFVAGDGGGIGGAAVARVEGQLAVLAIASGAGRLDVSTRDRLATRAIENRRRLLAVRPLLDALYRPPLTLRVPADDVTVCRCEEVTAGDLRGFVDLGCLGPNQAKAFGRCGMGPCQGRQCALTVTEVIAEYRGVHPEEVGDYRIRPPLKPITLAQLAGEQRLRHPSLSLNEQEPS